VLVNIVKDLVILALYWNRFVTKKRFKVGQTVHPVGFSLGVYRDWFARWFTRDSYGKQIIEDLIIRRFINAFLNKADIARVKIEKMGNNIRVILFSGRPGTIIGKKG